MDSDHPYRLAAGRDLRARRPTAATLIELPVHWSLDDWNRWNYVPGYASSPILRPSDVEAAWAEELDAIVEVGGLFNLTMHPFVSGRPARAAAIERLIERARAIDGLWIAAGDEIAAWVETLDLPRRSRTNRPRCPTVHDPPGTTRDPAHHRVRRDATHRTVAPTCIATTLPGADLCTPRLPPHRAIRDARGHPRCSLPLPVTHATVARPREGSRGDRDATAAMAATGRVAAGEGRRHGGVRDDSSWSPGGVVALFLVVAQVATAAAAPAGKGTAANAPARRPRSTRSSSAT